MGSGVRHLTLGFVEVLICEMKTVYVVFQDHYED